MSRSACDLQSPLLTSLSYTDETRDAVCYQTWVADWDTVNEEQLATIRQRVELLPWRPRFSVILLTGSEQGSRMHPSLPAQVYPYWEIAPCGSSLHITGDYIIPLSANTTLPAHALFEIAATLAIYPNTTMLFTDEDQVDAYGYRHSPCFRAAYDEDLMLGQNAVGSLAIYQKDLFQRAGGLRPDLPADLACYDLALRAGTAAAPETIRHLPAVLCHRHAASNLELGQAEVARNLVRVFLSDGTSVVPAPRASHWNRIVYQLPDPAPLVSVIIPTRDRADLLRIATDAVLHRTKYRNLELLIVDNGSIESETHSLFAALTRDARVRVLSYPGVFNWSAINNAAAKMANGDVLVFLNNDIDINDSEWLRELVSQALRPKVGVVGARLLYPDGRVQHAGMVVTPGGWPVHLYRFASNADLGYLGQLALVRSYSAVTGACIAIRRAIFEAVGGFEDRDLAVTFNDVDLCLRVRAGGWRVVCTPFAEIIHHELATRGSDAAGESQERYLRERKFMLDAWGLAFERDPFCSPNLNFEFDAIRLARPPHLVRPWQDQ